jgi:hypothetical protein
MPNARVSKLNLQSQINRLQRKHHELKRRIEAIDGQRLHLTTDEQLRINSLKKRKLAMKDELSTLMMQL